MVPKLFLYLCLNEKTTIFRPLTDRPAWPFCVDFFSDIEQLTTSFMNQSKIASFEARWH